MNMSLNLSNRSLPAEGPTCLPQAAHRSPV